MDPPNQMIPMGRDAVNVKLFETGDKCALDHTLTRSLDKSKTVFKICCENLGAWNRQSRDQPDFGV